MRARGRTARRTGGAAARSSGRSRAKKVLILTDGINSNIYLSTRNLQTVSVVPFSEVSAYDLMAAGELLIEAGALAPTTEVVNA